MKKLGAPSQVNEYVGLFRRVPDLAAFVIRFVHRLFDRFWEILCLIYGSSDLIFAHMTRSFVPGARPISTSLKSIPCGGRAMRTLRPSHRQRMAQTCAAASPALSPSASTITSRTQFGKFKLRIPDVESAAHEG